jgi:hypothetical protein
MGPPVSIHFHGPVYGGKQGLRELTDHVRREVIKHQQRNHKSAWD